ncbi:MAG: hypothetical protein ACE5I5_19120, partial [Candidatus Heimdallarchaeota archaeon]
DVKGLLFQTLLDNFDFLLERSYTNRSIFCSVVSIWCWRTVLAWGVLASASCLCKSSMRSKSSNSTHRIYAQLTKELPAK